MPTPTRKYPGQADRSLTAQQTGSNRGGAMFESLSSSRRVDRVTPSIQTAQTQAQEERQVIVGQRPERYAGFGISFGWRNSHQRRSLQEAKDG